MYFYPNENQNINIVPLNNSINVNTYQIAPRILIYYYNLFNCQATHARKSGLTADHFYRFEVSDQGEQNTGHRSFILYK